MYLSVYWWKSGERLGQDEWGRVWRHREKRRDVDVYNTGQMMRCTCSSRYSAVGDGEGDCADKPVASSEKKGYCNFTVLLLRVSQVV